MKYMAGNLEFTSKKENITHCVLFSNGKIAAKCSSFELAMKAKQKDERLYNLKGMVILEATKV